MSCGSLVTFPALFSSEVVSIFFKSSTPNWTQNSSLCAPKTTKVPLQCCFTKDTKLYVVFHQYTVQNTGNPSRTGPIFAYTSPLFICSIHQEQGGKPGRTMSSWLKYPILCPCSVQSLSVEVVKPSTSPSTHLQWCTTEKGWDNDLWNRYGQTRLGWGCLLAKLGFSWT